MRYVRSLEDAIDVRVDIVLKTRCPSVQCTACVQALDVLDRLGAWNAVVVTLALQNSF